MLYNRPKRNNKINAAKKVQDGITFDSTLELFLYNLLKEENIEFDFQQEFIIQEGFEYQHDKVLPIKIRPDFVLKKHNLIIDTKGFQMADGKLKYKMLKYYLWNKGEEYRIVMPSSQKKCREVLESIRRGYFTVDEPISEAVAKSRKKALTASGFKWVDGYWESTLTRTDAHIIMSLQKYDFEQFIKTHK